MHLDVSHLNLWFEAKNGYGTGGGRLYLRLSSPWPMRSKAGGRCCVGGERIFVRRCVGAGLSVSRIAGSFCCAARGALRPIFRMVPSSIQDP